MFIGGSLVRTLSGIEDLELRRERLADLIERQLVSPTLREQLGKAITELDRQIAGLRAANANIQAA